MPVVQASELTDFAAQLLHAGGFTPREASQTAELLVWANLRGADSHGVLRIPRYVEMVESGVIRAGQEPRLVREFGATCVYDYGKAPGAVAMGHASAKAGGLARAFGIGWCGARAISHAGAIGFFTSQLAERGLVGIAMAASRPLMSYHGARGEALSTNPLSIAVPRPGGAAPMVLDMSTAAVALGKIMAAKDTGKPIPKGWAVDANGVETEDPNAVAAILPMAGPKGSGLSLMIEILSSVLVGNAVIGPVLRGEKKGGFNGLAMALDPAAFGDASVFTSSAEELADAIHALEPAAGVDAVMLPGERGNQTARERDAAGIPLPSGTAKNLIETAQKLGVGLPAFLR
ncbi:dehydrogenase [Mesorhizobium sp. L-8-10]|uniref:Ldh family oxidoreductase n=1 Tax=Mesorhizobium sp. L-8-10 TaxID=2744523 RepID=UPI001926AD43|nr:Ldh family oxidoreductase [Mesorhizobium sp. L-8-10]BCH35714.1 dehydrogenase [Mesorhizobium sp. L-8-10]